MILKVFLYKATTNLISDSNFTPPINTQIWKLFTRNPNILLLFLKVRPPKTQSLGRGGL